MPPPLASGDRIGSPDRLAFCPAFRAEPVTGISHGNLLWKSTHVLPEHAGRRPVPRHVGRPRVARGAGPARTIHAHHGIYYVAAEDVDWNYAPLDSDPVFGRPLPEPWGVQTVYAKQRYVQYTDGTFTTTVPQPAWQGILGPMIRGVVGDTIKVVFHNKTGMPLSIHRHGVRYDPPDEGAFYDPPRSGSITVTSTRTRTSTAA